MSCSPSECTGHLIPSHRADDDCILKILSQETAGEEGKKHPHKKEPL